jgi:hypothetical protein
MGSLTVAALSFASIATGICLGFILRRRLPEEHFQGDAKDVVKLAAGLIATLSALVLGLLVGSAKGTFDAMNEGLKQGGARLVMLDRVLARYGPEAEPVRAELRGLVTSTIGMLWPKSPLNPAALTAAEEHRGIEEVHERCRASSHVMSRSALFSHRRSSSVLTWHRRAG